MESNPPVPLSDLINGCLVNDHRAEEQLYRWLSPRLFAVCLRYASDREAAEDILQEGFIKLFQKLSTYRSEGSFEGWARRIIVNTAIEHFRRIKPLVSLEQETPPQEPSLQETGVTQLEAKELSALIQELPVGYRTVFNLYAVEGYNHGEIAQQLGISEGTSKSQYARAKKWLQERLKKNS
ncbi:MAG: sigma-70 family RNA polymerase sigma factor [Bacteroidetes bacterium]|nr:sigma-70 family RNA polymerase sigma factor [Bacteroidota bacterium]